MGIGGQRDRGATSSIDRDQRSAHSGRAHLALPAAGDRIDALRRHPRRQPTAPTVTVAGTSGQLGQVTLDGALGEALAGLLGEVDDLAGNQLDGLDHAHGVDCRPPIAEVVEDHVCAVGKRKTDWL